jgi:hypothetical protein
MARRLIWVGVFLCSHHDDWDVHTPTDVSIQMTGLKPAGSYQVQQYLVYRHRPSRRLFPWPRYISRCTNRCCTSWMTIPAAASGVQKVYHLNRLRGTDA